MILVNLDKFNIYVVCFLSLVGILFSVPLFTAGAVLFYFSYLKQNDHNGKYRYLLYFLMAFCISYLNLSKPVNTSDLGYYYWLYEFAGTRSLSEYISLIPKEPLYHIYNYVMRILTFGNFNLFLVANTMIIYVLIMVSYDIICRHLNIDTGYAIIAGIILIFFSEFFFYTAQIIRQVLAGAVVFYALTKLFLDKSKRAVFLIVFAGLIHASAFIFLISLLFYFGRKIKFLYLVVLTLTFVLGYMVVLRALGGLIDQDTTLSMAINRGLSGSNDIVSVGLLPLLVCMSVLPMACYIMYHFDDSDIRRYLLMPIVLLLFILLNMRNPLYVLRFMEYIYMYIPVVVTLSIILFVSKPKLLLLLLMTIMVIRFGIKLSTSDFVFMSFSDFLFSGGPKFLISILNSNAYRLY